MNLGPPPVRSDERRAKAPIDVLSRRHDHVCTTAVDAWQIAAVLESDGITDRIARERYGLADVFVLADALYRRVPLRLKPSVSDVPREDGRTLWELARGPLFLLVGLLYPVAFAFGEPWPVALSLTLGLTIGWAASNGLSYLAYRRLAQTDGTSAGRFLMYRTSLLIAALISTLAIAAWSLDLPIHTVAPAAMLVCFQLSTSILLFARAEWRLAITLVPGVAANTIYLLSHGVLISAAVAAAFTAATVVATLLAAVRAVGRLPGGSASGGTPSTDLLGALAFSIYGGLTAVLLTIDALQLVYRTDLQLANAFGASIVPLVLTMGVIETLLRNLRNEAHGWLNTSHTRRAFAGRIWRSFARALTQYVAIIAVTSAAALPGIIYALQSAEHVVVLVVAQLLLGIAIFISFEVIAHSRIVVVVVALGVVVCLHAADVSGALRGLPPHGMAVGYLTACALYLALLLVVLGQTLARAETYR